MAAPFAKGHFSKPLAVKVPPALTLSYPLEYFRGARPVSSGPLVAGGKGLCQGFPMKGSFLQKGPGYIDRHLGIVGIAFFPLWGPADESPQLAFYESTFVRGTQGIANG